MMRILKPAVMFTCLGLASCVLGLEEHEAFEDELASAERFIRAADPVPGQYIVVLAEPAPNAAAIRTSELAAELAVRHGARIEHVYEHALRGFSAEMTEEQARALARDPGVLYIEEDSVVHVLSTPWSHDRVDQRKLPLDGVSVIPGTGAGVNAYVIDTGIRFTHVEFGGRAQAGFSSINDGRGASDCNGHGTAVAAVLGGATWGLAKEVTLHAVRVLSCSGSGTLAGVIAGVEWVTVNHVKPAVANMSVGGGASPALEAAVVNSIASGVTYVVSMDSSASGSCSSTPSNIAAAISVGSSTSTDSVAPFSGYGPCLDLYAPGVGVTTAWHTSNTAQTTLSGNSFAAPLVAATAALYLQIDPDASPATVQSLINTNASHGELTNVPPFTHNRLLYTRFIGTRLANGVPVTDPGHGVGDMRYFPLSVPDGMSRLDVRIAGGTGNADLYVKGETPPTVTSYDCRPYLPGNNEQCQINSPGSDPWHAMLRGRSAYTNVTLTAWFSKLLVNGVAQTGLSGPRWSQHFWFVNVPAGTGLLSISMSGGSGEADLYVRHGNFPSITSYDCRPYQSGNNENCGFSNPPAGTWFVMIRGENDFANVTLQAQYN